MTTLSERAAEEFIAAGAFAPGLPGFVGIAVDLLLDPARAPAGRRPLRHGFLDACSPRVMVVSGPPSPGLEVALRRMSDDLTAAGRIAEQHRLTILPQAADWAHPDGPGHALGTATAGIRVGLEAGVDDDSPLGLGRRWALAHTLAPVLAAAFANAPLRHGRPTGWRSVRQSLRRDLPVLPHGGATEADPPALTHDGETGADLPALPHRGATEADPPALPHDGETGAATTSPRTAWTSYVMNDLTVTGRSLRDQIRAGIRPTPADLRRHLALLRPPVAARGHLEIDVADRQPGDGWRVPAAVIATLLDDPRAAAEAWAATAGLAGEERLWERAARDALTDPVLAAAARACFMAAYAGLSRLGAGRELRDAVAEFTERHVHRGRCPADDVLDQVRISG